jgi:hypothetical protein
VHVRGHSRGGPHGAVDVSAYDRSPPSGAAVLVARATALGNVSAIQSSARRLRNPSAALSITTMVTVSTMKELVGEAPLAGTSFAKKC